MAAEVKHWREASTLILATARQNGTTIKPNFVNSSSASKAPSSQSAGGVNFDLLLLKRSSKSKFMPNLYVFPGGVASDVDFSPDWIAVFDLLGRDQRQNLFDFTQRGGQGAPMFSRLRDEKFSHIPSEVAFRICAIRETFEESGVLIARRVRKGEQFCPSLWDGESWGSFYEDDNASTMQEWRKRVIKDPQQFLCLCQELFLVPDVWSLYEWTNWLTPWRRVNDKKRRFDTAFFICCVDGRSHVAEDNQEMVHSEWGSPSDIIQQYYDSEVSVDLAPPQVYEIRRLMEFSTVSELLKFSWQRGQHRVARWFPVPVSCVDCIQPVFPLPGDSLYPEDVNPEGPFTLHSRTETLAELPATDMHRFIMMPSKTSADGRTLTHIACNVTLPGQHVAPRSTIPNGLGHFSVDTAKL